jgi:hypothetical protein
VLGPLPVFSIALGGWREGRERGDVVSFWMAFANGGSSRSHKYTQLPLIPVEAFLEQRPDLSDADESTLMEARIAHEHAERQALEEKRQGLLKKKQGLINDNNKRKEDLANLDKDLEKFIEVGISPMLCWGRLDANGLLPQAADPIVKTFEKEY